MKISINGVPTELTELESFLYQDALDSSIPRREVIKNLEYFEPQINKEVWFFLYDLINNLERLRSDLIQIETDNFYNFKSKYKCIDLKK